VKEKYSEIAKPKPRCGCGCVSGAMQNKEYLNVIRSAGFKNIEIK
jgi:hypothetical protein